MSRSTPSGTVHFSDETLVKIVAALPLGAPPERVALLPPILHAWAQEDLREHLLREGRAAVQQREKRLQDVQKHAKDMLKAIEALDKRGCFEMALRSQMRHEGTEVWNADTEAAERQREQALSWLKDLIGALDEGPRVKPPPDKRIRSYLIVRDLAAIFELVTGELATRRFNADTYQPYGPFWKFVNAVGAALPNVRSLDRAVKEVQTYSREYSPFVANLQFRHPVLWQKLREPR
jgi:hypothetical protein